MKCDNCNKDCYFGDGCFQCGEVYDEKYFTKTYKHYRIGLWCSKRCFEENLKLAKLKAKLQEIK